ncbi:C40 family peptidase [Kineosporia sp. J2-2]|uniref:C40 family peptidase n=1 Tax=Kineosporia corallincola TaxID=2835133 RepID=A0ABS5TDJ4_9ACTN|nr:C40 family peptidase [Kineosporia corallincola]MBT0767694.1 C40 family peptidase [Kineosporia corallincola]
MAAALALAVVLVGGSAIGAAADEPVPGQDEVRRAQRATDQARARVDAVQARLKASAQRVEAANVALSEAAEDYDYAQVKLHEAERASQAAQQVADRARERLDGAQEQVGELAAQSYRTGGPLARLDVLLSPEGPDQVLERASMLQVLAGEQQEVVRRADAARVVANGLTAQAAQALERRRAAADELAQAQRVARERAAQAQRALADDTRQKNQLLAELATARRTSVAVERARQEGLRRQAEQRREAAAREAAREAAERQAAERQAAQEPAAGSGTGKTGSGGSGSGNGSSGGSSSGSSSAGGSAVSWARARVGLPYLWGGEGPGSYDCSGLVMKAWARAGVYLPHSSRLQYQQVQHITYGSMRPGDLVFFATDTGNPDSIHHVAMYVGGGQMIEAPYTGAYVRVVPLRSSDAMPYAGRP